MISHHPLRLHEWRHVLRIPYLLEKWHILEIRYIFRLENSHTGSSSDGSGSTLLRNMVIIELLHGGSNILPGLADALTEGLHSLHLHSVSVLLTLHDHGPRVVGLGWIIGEHDG